MKHTQEQWEVSIFNGTWIVEAVNNKKECYPICTMDEFNGETVDKANANLIASAPEMLDALKEITEWFDLFCDCNTDKIDGCMKHDVIDLIAKAEGK